MWLSPIGFLRQASAIVQSVTGIMMVILAGYIEDMKCMQDTGPKKQLSTHPTRSKLPLVEVIDFLGLSLFSMIPVQRILL